MRVAGVLHIFQFDSKQGEDICMALQTHINDIMMKRYSRAKAASGDEGAAGGPAGAEFGPKYQAHVAELQRQLDEAREALEAAAVRLEELEGEKAAMGDELGVLRGDGGGGAAAAAVAFDLASLNLSGDDEAKYQKLLAAISTVEAEKAVLAGKLARAEEAHAAELAKLNTVGWWGGPGWEAVLLRGSAAVGPAPASLPCSPPSLRSCLAAPLPPPCHHRSWMLAAAPARATSCGRRTPRSTS